MLPPYTLKGQHIRQEDSEVSIAHTQLKKSDPTLYNRLLQNGIIKVHTVKTAVTEKPKYQVEDTYNIEKLLGSVSSGEVYGGTSRMDGRPVAIKVIKT